MSVKNPEADRLARELAKRQGRSITEVVTDALRAELKREKRRLRPDRVANRLLEIARRYDALPTLDRRSDEEILQYDEIGVPR